MNKSWIRLLTVGLGVIGLSIGLKFHQEVPAAVPNQKTIATTIQTERKAQQAVIDGASDERLISLLSQCQSKISDEIASKSKPVFAIYFPNYTAFELDDLASRAIAMRSTMGRPSLILEDADFVAEKIQWLRRFPSSISVTVESASDGFSGVKRWAAEYVCTLDGLTIKSVNRGRLYFFD
jgi:hypothetical protein